MNDKREQNAEYELSPANALHLAEHMCWLMFVVTPVVWWLQGPSVSPDQFAIRVTLIAGSALG